MDFNNINRGLSGSDNPAAITFFNPGTLRQYITIMGCTHKDYSSPLVDFYAGEYGVIENNTLFAGKTALLGQGIFLKSDIQNFSVRRNTSLTQSFEYGAIEVMMQAQSFSNNNIEISHNLVKVDASGSIRTIVYNWQSGNGQNNNPTVYVYRNTLLGNIAGLDSFPYQVSIENNVILSSNGLQSSGTNRVITASNNLSGGVASGITDLDGNLVGTYATYIGTHGHAISTGVIPLSSPTWK